MSTTREPGLGAVRQHGVAPLLHPQGRHANHRALTKKMHRRSPEEQWGAWAKHLARRKRTHSDFAALLGTDATSALLWGLANHLPETASSLERLQQLSEVERPKRAEACDVWKLRAEEWLARAASTSLNTPLALEHVAWAWILPWLALRLPAETWWSLLEHLLETAQAAIGAGHDQTLMVQQLLRSELPLTLAHVFPELEVCHQLGEPVVARLGTDISTWLDGEGMPHARHLDVMPALLACWTRLRALCQLDASRAWSHAMEDQFEMFVRRCLQLCHANGTRLTAGQPQVATRFDRSLLHAAMQFCDGRACPVIALNLGLLPEARKINAGKRDSRVERSLHSEWAEFALMREGWKPNQPCLALTYYDRQMALEFHHRGQVVACGTWDPQIKINHQPLQTASDWEEICWISEDGLDYIELEISYVGGWRLQRQVLFAHGDGFLYLADAVTGDQSATIEYQHRFPLANAIHFAPADEMVDGMIFGRKPLARVMPLALNEWRSERRAGRLVDDTGALILDQNAVAQRLYCPLFLDLDPQRWAKPMTWRQLTVGENLAIVPPDQAVGYRVQAGRSQWLFYRSLSNPASRTVLGQNFITDFIATRFLRNGETETLVEIEPADE